MTNKNNRLIFIGTGLKDTGIYSSQLNLKTGEFSETKLVSDAPKPGFLALHPTLDVLYATTAEDKSPSGAIRAYQFDRQSGELKLLGIESTGDNGATHLAVDRTGKFIAVAHYQGGSTSVLPIKADGSVGRHVSLVKHEGSSVHPSRQLEPFAHGVAISHNGRFVLVADLGTDEIVIYELSEQLQLACKSQWKSEAGAGPRHLALHANKRSLYCINELNSTIDFLDFNEETGQLTHQQTISTLPSDYTEKNKNETAELVIDPTGHFLYGSNRGHESTVIYAIDQNDGRLSPVGFKPSGGDHPRFIGMDPTSLFISANRNSDNLVSFQADPNNGLLSATGFETTVPKPTCVVFAT